MLIRIGLACLAMAIAGLCEGYPQEAAPAGNISDEEKAAGGQTDYDLAEVSRKLFGYDQRAFESYKAACDHDHAKGCEKAGYTLFFSDEVERDAPRGLRFYEKGCRLGNVDACVSAAFVYDKGDGVPVNHDMAQTFYQIACASGSGFACKQVEK